MVELSPEGVRSPHCPVCDEELVHQTTGFAGWACPQGHGVAATIPVVRTQVDGDTVAELWDRSDEAIPSGRACPFCRQLMVPVEAGVAGSAAGPGPAPPVRLDLCRLDQLIWFDPGELEELPRPAYPAKPGDQPPIIVNHWADAAESLPDWSYGAVYGAIVRSMHNEPGPED